LSICFLADANFKQRIVEGLLLRSPQIDFELPQNVIPQGMKGPQALELGAVRGRIIVTHDVRTMPDHFSAFVEGRSCPELILVPKRMAIRTCN
jgi:hypothetical protein